MIHILRTRLTLRVSLRAEMAVFFVAPVFLAGVTARAVAAAERGDKEEEQEVVVAEKVT